MNARVDPVSTATLLTAVGDAGPAPLPLITHHASLAEATTAAGVVERSGEARALKIVIAP